ncbi:MAG: protease complex subunit PrcB family protein [Lachnospiraceae bacterium]
MKKRTFTVLLIAVLCIMNLIGCKNEKLGTEKIKDVEFTVLLEEKVPAEFLTVLEEKKEAPFKLTFSDGEFLYVAVGYGMQLTGGYSIQVNDLYLTSNAIYCDTSLMGPTTEEELKKAASYPYIVLKMEDIKDKTVVFE